MNFPFLRGRERHAQGAARRRAARFSPAMVESLEGRQLLAAGNLGINVEITPFASFVNLLQTTGSWGTAPGQSAPIALNASGDPTTDAVLTYDLRVNQPWNGPDSNAVPINLSGTYHLSFAGQATIQSAYPGFSTPFAVQNQAYNAATNTTTADLVVPAANYSQFFAISFLGTKATAGSPANTGFSNAALIRPGYAAGSTQLYTNEFLAALQPYGTLRYLDPENTNGQPYYNGNTLVTVDAPLVDQTGMPWEYLVALANQTHTDMWVNVPQGATDAYVAAMAGLIKNGGTVNGVTYAGLDPSLKVYLEYSNEVWGGIVGNQYYQNAAVQNTADNHPLSTFPSNLHVYDNADGTTTTAVYTAAGRRYLERTADIGKIFQAVMGADPAHQRIRPVLGWQESNTAFYPGALDWYQHYFGPAGAAFYGMGNANYLSATDYSSVDAVFASLAVQEATVQIPANIGFTTLAIQYGLKNVSYEGGPSLSADGSTAAGQVALAASRDPRMEQVVSQHYLNFFADGGDLAMFFNGPFATWSPQNEWGAAELGQYGNPTASAKYRGTVDVANAAPAAITGGTPVNPLYSASLGIAGDSVGTSFADPYTGQQDYWLLNVTSAGTYDLALTTNLGYGLAPGQVQVLLNGKPVGGVGSVGTATTTDLGNLSLSAGLNALSIVVVHGANDASQGNASYYDFRPTALTLSQPGSLVNVSTGGTATAIASSNAGGGEGASQAFDGSASTKWLDFARSGWVQYQFAGNAAYAVSHYKLTAGADTSANPGRAPRNWTILGSNDGVTWTTLDTQANQADVASGDTRDYAIASPASFTYYRLNVTASNGDPIIQLAELQLLAPASAPSQVINRATGGTATSGPGSNAAGQGAAQAFDGSAGTSWLTFGTSGYIQYQFANGDAYAVAQYKMTSGGDNATYPGRAPRSWMLLGSNDGTTWATLDTQANQADLLNNDTKTYSIASPTAYRYYRLSVTASNGDPVIQLAELQLMAPPAASNPIVNRATGGTAAASSDNAAGGEGAAQAFDGSASTKWLTFANAGYIQYQFGSGAAYAVTQYKLTSANDTAAYPGRAPRNWALLGSNDGTTWATLDTQANQADLLNNDTKTYSIASPTAYRYYRLSVTASNGDPVIQLAELQLMAPPAASNPIVNRATGGTAAASSDNAAGGEGAAQAFDGSASTKWLTFANAGYIQYQFGSGAAYAVTQYKLTSANDTAAYPGRAPRNWTFLGSNDGTTWATLDTQANQADVASGDTRTYTIANATSYRYYRLNVTASNGDPIIQLAELQLLA